jgi:1-deoxyxylulose-5-phosphate synthase
MEYRKLTGTGATVSRICLGTYLTMGSQLQEAEAIRLIHHALDLGITFFDTADAYGQGESETILGKALHGKRDGVVVASKVRWQVGTHAQKDVGLTRWHITRGVEASLRRLGTDCLDICYFHSPDPETPLEESLAAADLLTRQGKVCYWGLSNYASWQVCRVRWLCERHGFLPPVVTQVVYNLLARAIEQEFLPLVRTLGMGVTVYSPLAAGLLTGKHRRGAPAAGSRFELSRTDFTRFWKDANFAALETLAEVAGQAGMTPTALALRWIAHESAIDSIIVGASRPEQLDENVASFGGPLDEATLAACDRVWEQLPIGSVLRYDRERITRRVVAPEPSPR